ncbi:hypothetical protein H696_06098 [Fonticula alba]|uniref:Uncharacterized protein n=1 Tax=Fonticula alba TaxID=691883 RepID=A0A058YZR4_FONAL|nr:hypothetical protein H696_06098 [Fonticula alba]KCV67459.1 hypothetical protein H696_06098 [Fonticula alba]|eukprot:XP_009498135.1 hypothetical protein H696_06098 [Fonticula alba]
MRSRLLAPDFGLTKAAELNVPYWSSPELLDGAAPGKPADIWALACTAMEFTTGAPPWAELQPATAAARLATSLPTPPGHASAELVAFLARCFVHDPAGRCTVDALLEDEWVSAVSPVIVEEAAAGAALPRQPAARPSKSDGPPSVVTSAGLVPSGGGPAGPVSGGAPVERMMIRVVMQLGEGESAKTIYVQRQITARALVSVILNKLSAYYNPEDYCIAEYHTTKEKQIFLDHEYPAQYYDSDQTLDFQLRIEPRPADMICGTLRRRRGRLMSRHWQTQYCVLDTHERYLAFYQRAPRPGEEALEPATDVIWDLTHIDSVVISSRDATRFAIECAGQVHHMAANSIDDALRWTNALRHASGGRAAEPVLELRWRPRDSFCHPVVGTIARPQDLALEVTYAQQVVRVTTRRRRRPRPPGAASASGPRAGRSAGGESQSEPAPAPEPEPQSAPGPEDEVVEVREEVRLHPVSCRVLGVVNAVGRFRSMADFQMVPDPHDYMTHLRAQINATSATDIVQIDLLSDLAPHSLNSHVTEPLPPPQFSRSDLPNPYGFAQNPSVASAIAQTVSASRPTSEFGAGPADFIDDLSAEVDQDGRTAAGSLERAAAFRAVTDMARSVLGEAGAADTARGLGIGGSEPGSRKRPHPDAASASGSDPREASLAKEVRRGRAGPLTRWRFMSHTPILMSTLANACRGPLYGGGLSIILPEQMVDASHFRPVPDNQEVFLSPPLHVSGLPENPCQEGLPGSLIVELLEMSDLSSIQALQESGQFAEVFASLQSRPSSQSRTAAIVNFCDLAQHVGCSSVQLRGEVDCSLGRADLDSLLSSAPVNLLPVLHNSQIEGHIIGGTHFVAPDERRGGPEAFSVTLAAVRVAALGTDIIFIWSRPLACPNDLTEEIICDDLKFMRTTVNSLMIHDWDMFFPDGPPTVDAASAGAGTSSP